jgi:hypothetical protein
MVRGSRGKGGMDKAETRGGDEANRWVEDKPPCFHDGPRPAPVGMINEEISTQGTTSGGLVWAR